MADVTESREVIQTQDVRYKNAVSESILSRFASAINFIMKRQRVTKNWQINGDYSGAILPFLNIDSSYMFGKDMTIETATIFTRLVGSSGTTELDVKWAAQGSNTWVSIFSTTPKFTTTATNHEKCSTGETVTGFTAAVMSKTNFSAGDRLRLDLIQAQTGSPAGCGLEIECYPR